MTKEEIFNQLDTFLDGLPNSENNQLEINGILIKGEWSSDLSDGEYDPTFAPPAGWNIFADGEFICAIEDGISRALQMRVIHQSLPAEAYNRDYKIHGYEMLVNGLSDPMPLPEPALPPLNLVTCSAYTILTYFPANEGGEAEVRELNINHEEDVVEWVCGTVYPDGTTMFEDLSYAEEVKSIKDMPVGTIKKYTHPIGIQMWVIRNPDFQVPF